MIVPEGLYLHEYRNPFGEGHDSDPPVNQRAAKRIESPRVPVEDGPRALAWLTGRERPATYPRGRTVATSLPKPRYGRGLGGRYEAGANAMKKAEGLFAFGLTSVLATYFVTSRK